MLKITTSNGDTLIHADQQPDAIIGKSVDGSQYLVHAGEWGRHKYIRKEGNRYIYPEDLQKANATQRHHAEVLADRRIAKKDRAHVKEDKEITNVMRKELRNYGVNLSKEDANQLRRDINTNGQIQSAHQRTVSTVSGTYNQERRATDPEAAKAQIAERRRRKEVENRPLRTADQQASAHQTSIKKTDNADGTKRMERRVTDADAAKAQIKERREKKELSDFNQRRSADSKERERKKNVDDLKGAYAGSNPNAKSLNEQIFKTAERKARKEAARETESKTQSGVEAGRKRVKKLKTEDERKKRPKSKTHNVIHGSIKVKRGASVKTNGPVGSR